VTFKRDIVLSVVLHVLIIAATLGAVPFKRTPVIDPGEIIRVNVVTAPPGRPQPAPAGPVVTPTPSAPVEQAKTIAKKPTPTKKPDPKKKRRSLPKDELASNLANQYAEKEIESEHTKAGSLFPGARIDNENFNYPYWFDQAFNKIAQNFRFRYEVDGTLVAVVYFQVIRSGRVIEVRLDHSSGIDSFDKACMEAVEQSSPFPPLPREFADEIIAITLPVKYGDNF
jgi:TonB family protein